MSGRASRVHSAAEAAESLLELTESAAQAEDLAGLSVSSKRGAASSAALCTRDARPDMADP